MRTAYLDNSATTPVCGAAAEAARDAMLNHYGNPSSLHALGVEAEEIVDCSRRAIADRLSAQKKEILFTSCGTEANNLALMGAAGALRRRGKRIVISCVEHPSVARTADALEAQGYEIVRLPVGADGVVPESALAEAITSETILVSLMLVNNETGAIQPVAKASDYIRRSGAPALLHCDAVQAFGKLPFRVKDLGADLITLSGHKIHAPKGVGALYLRRGVRILPQMHGGGQEGGLRSGTESVPLIAAFGAAVGQLGDLSAHLRRVRVLRERCIKLLRTDPVLGSRVIFHSTDDSLPYLLNFSLPGIRSETMLHYLEQRGVYVSAGSACAKGKKSAVLTALGLPEREIDSALRISFSRFSGDEDIDQLLIALHDGFATLAKIC